MIMWRESGYGTARATGVAEWSRLVVMAAYTDLKDFLAALEKSGDLRRISAPVDPTLEISEIVTRTVRAHGPALLFQRPTRGDMPIAINLFGTPERTAMALGVETLDEIGERIGNMLKPELPVGWSGIRDASARCCSSSRCRRRS